MVPFSGATWTEVIQRMGEIICDKSLESGILYIPASLVVDVKDDLKITFKSYFSLKLQRCGMKKSIPASDAFISYTSRTSSFQVPICSRAMPFL